MGKKKKEKKKHYWWRFLLVFLLGMITPLIITVVGGAAAAAVVPVSTLVSLTGQDATGIIGEEYLNGSLLSLTMSIINDASTGQIQTLGGVSKYSPLIEEKFEELNENVINRYLGFKLDYEVLKEKKFDTELGDYLASEIQEKTVVAKLLVKNRDVPYSEDEAFAGDTNALIASMLFDKNLDGTVNFESPRTLGWFTSHTGDLIGEITLATIVKTVNADLLTGNDIVKALCYKTGESGQEEVKISELMSEDGIEELMDRIPLTALDLDESNPIVKYIIYPKDEFGNFITDSPRTVGDLKTISDIIDEAQLQDFLTIPSDSVLYSFRETKIKDLANIDIGEKTLGEVLSDEVIGTSGILFLLKDKKIKNLKSEIYALTVGDIVGTGNELLAALGGYTLQELSDDPNTIVNNLTISQLFGSSSGITLIDSLGSYTIGYLKTNGDTVVRGLKIGEMVEITDTTSLMYKLRNSTIDSISNDIKLLKLGDVLDSTIIGTNSVLSALANAQISNLANAVNALKLGQIITIDPADPNTPLFLINLQNTPLSELSSSLKGLTLGDIFSQSQLEGNKFLAVVDPSTKINDIPNKIGQIRVEDVFFKEAFNNYYPTLAAKQAASKEDRAAHIDKNWKNLLTQPGQTYVSACVAPDDDYEYWSTPYTIEQMGQLVTNLQNHMAQDTIQSLCDDGLVTLGDATVLTKHVPDIAMYEDCLIEGQHYNLRNKVIGTLTIVQFMYVMSSVTSGILS